MNTSDIGKYNIPKSKSAKAHKWHSEFYFYEIKSHNIHNQNQITSAKQKQLI